MYVDVILDKPRRLRFDLSAFRTLEDAMDGQPIGVTVNQLTQFSLTALCLALWAGLKHEDRKLTRSDVERAVEGYVERGGDLMALTRTLNEAMSESPIIRSLLGSKEPEGNGQPGPTAE